MVTFLAIRDKRSQSHYFQDHHGMLRVAKSAALNSLLHVPRQSHEAKYLFKSSRTRLSIEKIHLPPDLGEEDAKVDKKSIEF